MYPFLLKTVGFMFSTLARPTFIYVGQGTILNGDYCFIKQFFDGV